MGKTAFPFSPIREPREIAGIFHEPKDQKEITHDRKDDREGIGEGHCEEAVRTDEKFLEEGNGNETLYPLGERRENPTPEDGLL
jgi:hypothetical protein